MTQFITYATSDEDYLQLGKLKNCFKDKAIIDELTLFELEYIKNDTDKLKTFLTSDIQVPLEQSAMTGWVLLTGNFRILLSMYLDVSSLAANFADEISDPVNSGKKECVRSVIGNIITKFDDVRMAVICGQNITTPCDQWSRLTDLFAEPVESERSLVVIPVMITVGLVAVAAFIIFIIRCQRYVKWPYSMGKGR